MSSSAGMKMKKDYSKLETFDTKPESSSAKRKSSEHKTSSSKNHENEESEDHQTFESGEHPTPPKQIEKPTKFDANADFLSFDEPVSKKTLNL